MSLCPFWLCITPLDDEAVLAMRKIGYNILIDSLRLIYGFNSGLSLKSWLV